MPRALVIAGQTIDPGETKYLHAEALATKTLWEFVEYVVNEACAESVRWDSVDDIGCALRAMRQLWQRYGHLVEVAQEIRPAIRH